jgi:hypothetical protein
MSLSNDELERRLILLEGRVSQLQLRVAKLSKPRLKELRGTPEPKNPCEKCESRITFLGPNGPTRYECFDSWYLVIYLPWAEANNCTTSYTRRG